MEELIFEKLSEIPRIEKKTEFGIFQGFYKFSTQRTAVYDNYCLIQCENEIMKIEVECDKAFYRNNKIAIINGKTCKIFKDFILEKTIKLEENMNVTDFTTNLENDLKEMINGKWIFEINGKLLKIDNNLIDFDGNTYPNEIHEKDSSYFVGYQGDLIVVGNNKSLNFLYFSQEKKIQAEESCPIFCRMDSETFEPIFMEDLKFVSGKLIAIDREMASLYSIKDVNFAEKPKSQNVNDYCIKDNKVVHISAQNNDYFGDLNRKEYKITSSAESVNLGELKKDKGQENTYSMKKGSLIFDSDIDLDAQSNILSIKEDKTQSSVESVNLGELQKDKEQKNTHSLLKKSTIFNTDLDSQSNMSEVKTSLNSLFSAKFSTSPAGLSENLGPPKSGAEMNQSSVFKKTDLLYQSKELKNEFSTLNSSEIKKKEDKDQAAIKKLSDEYSLRIDNMMNSIRRIGKRKVELPILKFIEPKYELTKLYECIFHNNLSDYEKMLSSMATELDKLKSYNYSNIEECIKYFDSKIFQNQVAKYPVHYNKPLCSKTKANFKIPDTINNFIEEFKILKLYNATDNKSFDKDKRDYKEKSFIANKEKEILKPEPLISENSDRLITSQVQTKKTPESTNLFSCNKNTMSLIDNAQTMPSGFSTFSESYQPIDTGSLFSSIASQNLRTDNIRTFSSDSNMPNGSMNITSPKQDEPQHISAFNKLAGSRRIFK